MSEKRKAEGSSDEPSAKAPKTMEDGPAGGGMGTTGGNSSFSGEPRKIKNKYQRHFTKTFRIKLYANDWQIDGIAGQNANVIGFMNVIPWQALCMYISPTEYMELLRSTRYAKIVNAKFDLCVKSQRTPFTAGSTDTNEANGNLQWDFKRWDGLEQMMPFNIVDFDYGSTDKKYRTTYMELINRLYRGTAFVNDPTTTTWYWPACMQERGLTWRPEWHFENSGGATSSGPLEVMVNSWVSALPVYEYQSEDINTNETKTTNGYCFTKTYQPKNGIITMASSGFTKKNMNIPGRTRINVKTRMQDSDVINPTSSSDTQYIALYPRIAAELTGNVTTTTVPASHLLPENVTNDRPYGNQGLCPTDEVQWRPGTRCAAGSVPPAQMYLGRAADFNIWDFHSGEDPYGLLQQDVVATVDKGTLAVAATGVADNTWYGYQNSMAYYAVADLENYQAFTSRNDPPIHHMESMLLGAVPKTNKDRSIVQGTFECEIRTMITVECEDVIPTYVNMMYRPIVEDGVAIGYQQSGMTDDLAFGRRWQVNETDVCLSDEMKYWTGSYGLAAKPIFNNLPTDTPLL